MKKEKINEIKNIAVYLDWNVAFDGKSRGNRHLFRVNKIVSVKELIKELVEEATAII